MVKPMPSSLLHVHVPIAGTRSILEGDLAVPGGAAALVLFAHGSGSSRHSPRNQAVAGVLRDHGFGTLLIDLLTPAEEAADRTSGQMRFDIGLLASRVMAIVDWARQQPETSSLPLALFGASTGAAAALVAAAARPAAVAAVICRGGRPDLAGDALPRVHAPVLLIVGGADSAVLEMNRDAMRRLRGSTLLEVIPGATHLFEEPGALQQVASLAAGWLERCLETSAADVSSR